MVKFYKAPTPSGKTKSNSKAGQRKGKRQGLSGSQREETLVIDAMDHHGKGIALSTSPITVVDGALIGETVKVKLNSVSKTVRRGKVTSIIAPSPKRIEPPCKVYAQCGGCSLQSLSAHHGLTYKHEALIAYFSKTLNTDAKPWYEPILSDIDYNVDDSSAYNIAPDTDKAAQSSSEFVSKRMGYRRKVRFAVDARNTKNIKIGYRQSQSSAAVDIQTCPILHPSLLEKVEALLPRLRAFSGIQKIGHIECTLTKNGVLVFINAIKSLSSDDTSALEALSTKLGVRLMCQCKGALLCEFGESYASLSINDFDSVELSFKAQHFLQVNAFVNAQMLQQAIEWLAPSPSSRVLDFYCGLGNFSIPLAKHCASLVGYEGVNEMVQQAEHNAAINACDNAQFYHADLSDTDTLNTLHISHNDMVLLDPSREGAQGLSETLVKRRPLRIVYVSCNANTLQRDLNTLAKAYKISALRALDMFPFTGHLEVMALLERKAKA